MANYANRAANEILDTLGNLAKACTNLTGRGNNVAGGLATDIHNTIKNSKTLPKVAHDFVGAGKWGKGLEEDEMKWYHFNTDITNEAGEVIGHNTWNGAAIGGVAGLGAIGARFASGGGVYRDANGNTDIVGVPFI